MQWLARICVQRPIFASVLMLMLMLVVVVLGRGKDNQSSAGSQEPSVGRAPGRGGPISFSHTGNRGLSTAQRVHVRRGATHRAVARSRSRDCRRRTRTAKRAEHLRDRLGLRDDRTDRQPSSAASTRPNLHVEGPTEQRRPVDARVRLAAPSGPSSAS